MRRSHPAPHIPSSKPCPDDILVAVLPLMRVTAVAVLFALFAAAAAAQGPVLAASWLAPYRDVAARLMKAATADDFAWHRLAELTDTFGHRLSGSANLAGAIDWAVDAMKKDGLDHVHTERVMVPRWVRGNESAEIVGSPDQPLSILGLGGTVATPPAGTEAEVLTVTSFDDLRSRGSEARGRIVLFNAPFTSYGDTVAYRTGGARAAALQGAVGVLVRAVGPTGLRTPHTGAVQYSQGTMAVPAASITAEDANRIVRLAQRGQPVRVRLTLSGRFDADAESANVVAEIRGREFPEEIVLIGGHLDSWDVGTGASDDGVGCIITWEAVRLMKKLGIQPRRTVRVVLFTNEENGLRGGAAYAERHAEQAHNHVFALESDSGVFAPASLGFSGSPAARALVRDIGMLLAPIGMSDIGLGGGGADVGPIAQAANAPTMAYLGEPQRYFQIHHTPADTIERIAPEEISKAAAAIAVVTYVVAEMPERLPR
jgi:carboxypeptidase Q